MNVTAESISKNVKPKEQWEDLKNRWDELKAQNPGLRTKNTADELGVSEAALIASACDGETVIRLGDDWEKMMAGVESLGEVMALTRNEAAVHEKTGVYQNVSFSGHAGVVLNGDIDLRVFPKRWGFAFAAPVENPRGRLYSLQFFDKEGTAVHKIYLKDESRADLYKAFVDEFRAEDQSPGIELKGAIKKAKNLPLSEVEADVFLEHWNSLKDTHAFYPLLRKHKVARTDALKLATGRFSWQVDNDTVRKMLTTAAERQVSIMVFVGNKGMIQIHSGPVKKVKVMNEWINILDPGFNLHLREDLIAESWIVEKPTEDGIVTSLEVFDKNGEIIASFFGSRKPGKPELPEWTALAAEIKAGAK